MITGHLAAILACLQGTDAALRGVASDGRLAAGVQQEVAAGHASVVEAGDATAAENLEFLAKTLKRFESFAETAEQSVRSRHIAEEQRLQEAIFTSNDATVKTVLQQTVQGNNQSLMETEGIYQNIVKFSKSIMAVLDSTTKAGVGCNDISCGLHASCTDSMEGASCVCDEGYIGQGKDCRAPPEFMPHLLVQEGAVVKAADLHVDTFGDNKIAIVFRDTAKGNAGLLVVGKVFESGLAQLSPPEFFTKVGMRAFQPVVTGNGDRNLAIAWRDENMIGTCRMRAAELGASGIRGAEMALTWGEPVDFCSQQAHKMSILPLEKNRIMVLYSDKVKESQHADINSFGNSILAEIGDLGSMKVLGNFRFAESSVARLEAAKVGSNSFVLAARASPAVDEMNPQILTKQEALVMYGEMVGDDLVFDPNVVNLEPNTGDLWARGVSLIAPNTIAYAYQDAGNMLVKTAVISIEPETHRLKVVQTPETIKKGFSPYVSMLSVPYTESDPHSLIYYEGHDGSGVVNLCAWDAKFERLQNCEDFTWLSEKISSVSGSGLGGGKSFMVFTSESGTPFYSIFGLSKQ